MARAVERRADQLGHARVENDLASASIPHVQDGGHQPAGARDEEPTRLDRQSNRPPIVRDGSEQRRQLAGEAGRSRRGIARGEDRKAAADVERVEGFDRAAPQGGDREGPAHGVAPGVDGAKLRADVEMDPARPERSVRPTAGVDRRGQLGARSSRTWSGRRRPPAPAASPGRRPGSAGRARRAWLRRPRSGERSRPGRPPRPGLDRHPAKRPAVACGKGRGLQVRRRSCRSPPG